MMTNAAAAPGASSATSIGGVPDSTYADEQTVVEESAISSNTGDAPRDSLSFYGPLKTPTGKLCQVFISHSGRIKREFVDFLYAEFKNRYRKVEVFLDEYSLKMGGDPLLTMHEALGDAVVVVVIVTKSFISEWPMEELKLVLQRHQRDSTSAVILPVFLGMNWDAVDKEAGLLRKAAAAAGPATDKERALRVQWADSLDALKRITGWRTDQVANGRWTLLIPEIVKDTAIALASKNQLRSETLEMLPSVVIGLAALQDTIVSQLKSAGNHQMVLLTGMAGIGKTTLAKAVFNKLQLCYPTTPHYFLVLDADMKEEELKKKQQELLMRLAFEKEENVELRDTGHGRQLLGDKLNGERVLLVVDNVWEGQLQWLLPGDIMQLLGEGSMVLITSQDQRAALLGAAAGSHWVEEGVQLLSADHSMELFCRYATKTGAGAIELDTLVDAVCTKAFGQSSAEAQDALSSFVTRCGGLPMSLSLAGECMSKLTTWSEFLKDPEKSLKEALNGLFQQLMFSWNALKLDCKAILLDVVWFLNGCSWGVVECYCSRQELEELQKRGLITLQGDGGREQQIVVVHPAVADFCKMYIQDELVEKTGVERPLERRMVVPARSACRKPSKLTATWRRKITAKAPKTVGLKLQSCVADATLCELLPELTAGLRVLQMAGCSQPDSMPELESERMQWLGVGEDTTSATLVLPVVGLGKTRARPKGVVVLEAASQLSRIEFTDSDCFLLKGLWITKCDELQEVDLSGLGALQQLRIAGCEKLQKVEGWSHLTQLEVLELSGCSKHVAAPCLTSQHLTELRVHDCGILVTFPECLTRLLEGLHIGNGHGLRVLDLSECPELVDMDLSGLSILTQLRIAGCKKLQQVQGWSRLPQLEVLEMSGCSEQVVASCLASMTDSAPCPIAKLLHAPQHRQLEMSEHPTEVRLTDCRGIAEFPGSFFRHGPKLWIKAFPQLQAGDLSVLDALQQLSIAGCTISRTVRP